MWGIDALNKVTNQSIFISALDWGMGHLTRTAALVRMLEKRNEVVIFSAENQRAVYSELFPGIRQVSVPTYAVQFYPHSVFRNILGVRSFYRTIKAEHQVLKKYVERVQKPDIIISDHRYGFYYKGVKNIFLTHQVCFQVPAVLGVLNTIHHRLLSFFDEIWVPDYAENERALAGRLSHSKTEDIPLQYIQPLSLMKKSEFPKDIDCLFIISGTEAEKVFYEKYFYEYAQKLLSKKYVCKIVGGIKRDGKIFLGWKDVEEINCLIARSRFVITRAGYSTLMDWHTVMDKEQRLFLCAPKYQYEQKYLCRYWIEKGWAKDLSLIENEFLNE